MQKPRKLHTQIKDQKYNEYHARVMKDMENPSKGFLTLKTSYSDEDVKRIGETLKKAFESMIGNPSNKPFRLPDFGDKDTK